MHLGFLNIVDRKKMNYIQILAALKNCSISQAGPELKVQGLDEDRGREEHM